MVHPPLAPFRPSQRKSSLGLGAHPVTSNKYKHIDLSAHATPAGVRIASCSWAIRNAETNGLRDAGWTRLLAEWQTPPELYEVGISGQDAIVGMNQGWKLSGAIKTADRKLADRTVLHGGQGLMAWAVSNARVEPKGNAIVITKQASGSAKIDPLMAAFNAIALMSTNPWSHQEQIFVI